MSPEGQAAMMHLLKFHEHAPKKSALARRDQENSEDAADSEETQTESRLLDSQSELGGGPSMEETLSTTEVAENMMNKVEVYHSLPNEDRETLWKKTKMSTELSATKLMNYVVLRTWNVLFPSYFPPIKSF